MKQLFHAERAQYLAKRMIVCLAFGLAMGLGTSGSAEDASDPLLLTFEGRNVKSAPYYYAFPYRIEKASIEHQKIYFSRHVEGEGKRLFVTDWDTSKPIPMNSDIATKVTDIDLNTINFWDKEYNKKLNGLIVEADDDKAERINLWVFADGADAPKRVTDVDYVYEFTQADDHSAVYYTARYGASDASKGCLEAISIQNDGTTQTRQLICDDNPDMPAQINWWGSLRADKKRVIFPALKDGDRNKQELYAYDLSDGSVSLVFEGHGKSWVSVWNGWGGEDAFLVSADRDLFRYDSATGETILLKTFKQSISNHKPAGKGNTPPMLLTTETPFETKLELLEIRARDAVVLSKSTVPEDVWLADGHDGLVLVGKFSPEVFAAFQLYTLADDGSFTEQEAVEGLTEINDQLNQCDVERVKVHHTDKSEVSPGDVSLDVFLYRPRNLPPIADQKFVITAFYGGRNQFSSYHHVFCALGLTTVSPAVRGDWRYGTEFANGNDREKADAPIRDTLAVARYLVDRFGIPSTRQIGTTGYSHGGWASVRALSYPGPEHLKLGFAIAGGGFYDLPDAVDPAKNGETNIHGWFDKEFGTADQSELLAFLSPSNHIYQIDAPIFLYHAERDTRVSINQMNTFAAKLSEAGKSHRQVIIQNQGHSIRGPEIWRDIRQQILDFIADAP